MICPMCKQDKDDVSEWIDPFTLEINDEQVEMVGCMDCYRERLADI